MPERDLNSVVDEVQRLFTDRIFSLTGYWVDCGGTFEQLESARQRLSVIEYD